MDDQTKIEHWRHIASQGIKIERDLRAEIERLKRDVERLRKREEELLREVQTINPLRR
jgi:prefoldin subunit 5